MSEFKPTQFPPLAENYRDIVQKSVRGMVFFDENSEPVLLAIGAINSSQVVVCETLIADAAMDESNFMSSNTWDLEKLKIVSNSEFGQRISKLQNFHGFSDLLEEIDSRIRFK